MKKEKKILLLGLLVLLIAFAFSTGLVLAKSVLGQPKETAEEVATFEKWTDDELFVQIPAMDIKGARVGELWHTGEGYYTIDIEGTTKEDYSNYLELLKDEGWDLLVDNGETGIDNSVFTANLAKEDIDLAVVYMERVNKTQIIAAEGKSISKYLVYDEAATTEISTNAKNKLHMLELFDFGTSFVFQLKNNHFIVNDGGNENDLIYLIEYLEKLVPEGEIPVIDAWIISHAHGDHCGLFTDLLNNPEWGKRIYVEEFLFNQPNMQVLSDWGTTSMVELMSSARQHLKTTEGKTTPIYRPIMGQKYYFCDVVVEVMFSQEFLKPENYSEDFNDCSTWLMYHIDGQKALLGGDGDWASMHVVMRTYNSSYFELDVFSNMHHGINVFDEFNDFCKFKTVLVTFYDDLGDFPPVLVQGKRKMNENVVKANADLKERSDELYTGYGGTLVLTFPYVVGTAERLAPQTWSHNGGTKGESSHEAWYRIYQENGGVDTW